MDEGTYKSFCAGASYERFVGRLEHAHRSVCVNTLLKAIRERGATTPEEVVSEAQALAAERLSRYGDRTSPGYQRLVELIDGDREAAEAGAEYALWWQGLSEEERDLFKRRRAEFYRSLWRAGT